MNLSDLVSSSHQSIKIVPSIEDSLQEMGLDVNLDEQTILWFNQLQLTWMTWRKSPTVENHLKSLYQFDNPFRIALVCIIKCQEFKDCKPKTLPFYIIESLQKWSQMNNRIPDESLKLPAFHITTLQRNQYFLNKVVKTFDIKTIKHKVLPQVIDMIKNDNCKQATQFVSALELYDEIPIEDLLFPLILQDKINIIDEYLAESPSQVRPLLKFLDSLLDKKCNIKDYFQKFIEDHKVYNVKHEKLHHKPLGKLVARICNKYNVPIETCKNLSKNRTSGGLRYLIYQKYVEHNVSASVWDDLVKDSLKKSEGCAEEFINMLIDYDHNEALKWATYLNIPEDNLPTALQNLSVKDVPIEEENWDVVSDPAQKFYELSLPENCIIMIDTTEKFYDVMNQLEKCNLVSIDCEWKPSFGAAQSQVALIQVATPTCIYLIDTIIFNDKQYSSFWHRFNKGLLENDEIIKLGFGLEQDLKEIKASIIGLYNIKIKGEGLLDLSLLWRTLIDSGLSFPNTCDIEGKGLSSLVQICFGVPLKKTEQCSNWELRPLRKTQIHYAALDAYVLLDIYSYLQKLSNECNINFEEVCNEVMLDKKAKIVKKPKAIHKLEATACTFVKEPKHLKLLVEPELSRLVAYLRYCGIDTAVISTSMVWHDSVGFAMTEDRCIVTTKLKLTSTSKFPQNCILDVGKGTVKDHLQRIFTYFNVSVHEKDLFMRCVYCNGLGLRPLNCDELSDIYNKSQTSVVSTASYNRFRDDSYDEDYDDALDNFLSESDDEEPCIYPPPKQNTPCTTSKGATIDLSSIQNVYSFAQTHKDKSITLCDDCGKLYWDEDDTFKCIRKVVLQLLNLSV
ncbi:exonuclease mut-7 homolog [Colias croceus]|uniref:exonuclease mut-7 homolog n=1 Tax=Colias crocea TaxID=72248 RepID=UPI001E27E912|nr:exonuclease mut-7 homolog [Colias croceus]